MNVNEIDAEFGDKKIKNKGDRHRDAMRKYAESRNDEQKEDLRKSVLKRDGQVEVPCSYCGVEDIPAFRDGNLAVCRACMGKAFLKSLGDPKHMTDLPPEVAQKKARDVEANESWGEADEDANEPLVTKAMQMGDVAALQARRDEAERLESVAQPDADLKLVEDDDDQQKDLRLNLDTGEKKDVVTQLRILLEKAKDDMANDIKEWDAVDKAYDAKLAPRPYSWQSNVCTPVVQIKCDKVHGAIVGEVSNGNPLFALEPQETSDVERVKKIEKFLEAVGTKEMKIVTQVDYVCNDSVRYGTGIMECPWVHETESVTEVQEYDGLKLEDVVKFEETFPHASSEAPDVVSLLVKGAKVRFSVEDETETYRGPRPKHVPIRDFRYPGGYTDPNKMPFQFKRWMISWSELETGVKNGKYEQEGLDSIRAKWAADQKKIEKKDPQGYINKEYEIFEGWWVYNTVGKVHEKCVFTLIPEYNAYLRGMKYPFTHNRSYFIEFKIMEQPMRFLGLGIGSRARRIQYVMNMIMNMILNNAIDSDAANWPMYVHKTSTKGQNLDRQGYRPFKVFEVAQGDDLTPLASGANTSNSLNLYSLLQRIGDDATRVSELYTGGESKGDPDAPAAKTKMLLQVSQQGLVELLKTFLKGWTELTFQIIELYSQYGTKGKEFRILNEAGEPSRREEAQFTRADDLDDERSRGKRTSPKLSRRFCRMAG